MEIEINRDTILWIVIAFLIVLVAYVVFFQGDATTTGEVAGQAGTTSGSGMVGGC